MPTRSGANFNRYPNGCADANKLSSSPLNPLSSLEDHGPPSEPPTSSPHRWPSEPAVHGRTSTSNSPSTSADEGPFAGLVFGVLPDQWDQTVLLEAQRMIVVSAKSPEVVLPRTDSQLGGGRIRRPGATSDYLPELLLSPLVYEQRTPGASLAEPLPPGWSDLKLVVTPWVVSCHVLGRRLSLEGAILLGLDPSIMLSSPEVATSATRDLRHYAADLEEKLAQAHDRHAAEVAAMQARFRLVQEELDRRSAPATCAEEITKIPVLRVELERQLRAFDTDNWVQQDFGDHRSDVKGTMDALDRPAPSLRGRATAECSCLTKACEDRKHRTVSSAAVTTTVGEDKSAALTSISDTEALNSRLRCGSSSQLPDTTVGSSMRELCFPSWSNKRPALGLEPAPPAKKRKPHPFWSRVFG